MSPTNFSQAPQITDKTYLPDDITIDDFLDAVFQGLETGTRPVLARFRGNPCNAKGKHWQASPWLGSGTTSTNDLKELNNYFSLASFKHNNAGGYQRKKEYFYGLYTVLLDDIGTKVAINAVLLEPSWQVETSPGNYQFGYLLREPITDSKLVDVLAKAIIKAELTDPGAGGFCTRMARLPVGVNGKHCPPFKCVLRAWSPERRYTLEELFKGLRLELPKPGSVRCGARSKPNTSHDSAQSSSPHDNPVIAALKAGGHYKVMMGSGKHDITCPWVAEHSDGVDGGTAYFEPSADHQIGGFKCFHGHCIHRHIQDLLEHLKIDPASMQIKPTIRIIPGELHRVVDDTERLLSKSGNYFQISGSMVTIIKDPVIGQTRTHQVTQAALACALARDAVWEKYDGRAGDWTRADPPVRHLISLLDQPVYKILPVLKGIARQPYMRLDGSLVTVPGYDVISCMYGDFVATDYSVPENPTKEEATKALEFLKELVSEFGFASPCDQSAALSAILTAAVRPSLDHAPMFHVRAHTPGSGKSYLCQLITAFAAPLSGAPTAFPSDDDECRKLILSELLHAPTVIEFDNLTSDLLPHKSLCTALTSELISGRLLGVSKTATVSTRTLFLSSGNNVGPIKDMARRCVTINLDAGCEMPAERNFLRPDLISDVLKKRGFYVSAALTLIRAWVVAGRPFTPCKPLASFGQWSEICRQPLLWLGCTDPSTSLFEAIILDPDRELLGRLQIAWHARFGRKPAMVRDAAKCTGHYTGDDSELCEILKEIAEERGEINRRRLGWWIRQRAGQIVNGLRFVRVPGNRSAEQWIVDGVDSVL